MLAQLTRINVDPDFEKLGRGLHKIGFALFILQFSLIVTHLKNEVFLGQGYNLNPLFGVKLRCIIFWSRVTWRINRVNKRIAADLELA